jgi:hypothetical protein
MPPPAPPGERKCAFTLPDETFQRVVIGAFLRGMSKSAFVAALLEVQLDALEDEEAELAAEAEEAGEAA